MTIEKVLIQLMNMDTAIEDALVKEKFEVFKTDINGYISKAETTSDEIIRIYNKAPANLHEMDYIVISNETRPAKKNTGKGYFQFLPKDNSDNINFIPFDMFNIMNNLQEIITTQCVIFFTQNYYAENLHRVNISLTNGTKKRWHVYI